MVRVVNALDIIIIIMINTALWTQLLGTLLAALSKSFLIFICLFHYLLVHRQSLVTMVPKKRYMYNCFGPGEVQSVTLH